MTKRTAGRPPFKVQKAQSTQQQTAAHSQSTNN